MREEHRHLYVRPHESAQRYTFSKQHLSPIGVEISTYIPHNNRYYSVYDITLPHSYNVVDD